MQKTWAKNLKNTLKIEKTKKNGKKEVENLQDPKIPLKPINDPHKT